MHSCGNIVLCISAHVGINNHLPCFDQIGCLFGTKVRYNSSLKCINNDGRCSIKFRVNRGILKRCQHDNEPFQRFLLWHMGCKSVNDVPGIFKTELEKDLVGISILPLVGFVVLEVEVSVC